MTPASHPSGTDDASCEGMNWGSPGISAVTGRGACASVYALTARPTCVGVPELRSHPPVLRRAARERDEEEPPLLVEVAKRRKDEDGHATG
jgi:hypothetical protein